MTHNIDDLVWTTNDLPVERRLGLKRDLVIRIARHDRRRRRLRVGAGIGVTATAAASTIAVMLSSTPAASAAWSAVPAPLTISVNDPMVAQCLADLPAGPSDQIGQAQLTPMVAERRGTSRAALLGGYDSQAICITTPTSRTGGRTLSPALPVGHDISLTGNGGSTDAASGDRYVYGRVSPRVDAVTVTTTTGLQVTASVAHGSYFAWWPGGAGPATITAEGLHRRVIATVSPAPAR